MFGRAIRQWREARLAQQKDKRLQILRDVALDHSDKRAWLRLVKTKSQIAAFLETDLDNLEATERFKIYHLMEAVFPSDFNRIIAVRLERETDPSCRDLLLAIAPIN